MTTIDKIIDQVLYENNKHWLNPEQAEYNIAEGRVPITRQDIHDVIKKLPIKIVHGENMHVEITDEGIIIKESKHE
jgi:D-serine dehydratase